jgi:hypothetical protein
MYRGIKPIEILVQAQRVVYLAAFDDSLAHRSSEATTRRFGWVLLVQLAGPQEFRLHLRSFGEGT